MSRLQDLVDKAFHQWEYAELKAQGLVIPQACSSDIACALPLSSQKRARIKTAFARQRTKSNKPA